MKEFFKKNSVGITAIVCSLLFAAMTIIGRLDRERVAQIAGENHIKIVTVTDKNCNDCHLGASFVNLFNHPAVKSNDNVVSLMMDRAKIKRW